MIIYAVNKNGHVTEQPDHPKQPDHQLRCSSYERILVPLLITCLLVLPHPALRDETLPAELAVVALDAEVLVLRLLVLVQVVLLGCAVVALVTHIRLLSRVSVHVLPKLVLRSEFAT